MAVCVFSLRFDVVFPVSAIWMLFPRPPFFYCGDVFLSVAKGIPIWILYAQRSLNIKFWVFRCGFSDRSIDFLRFSVTQCVLSIFRDRRRS